MCRSGRGAASITNQNAVYMECFIRGGRARRRRRLAGLPPSPDAEPSKHLAVLNAAADKAATASPCRPACFRGIAQFMGYGSYSAAVAEVSVSAKGP